jgi:quinol monooxygenase YgiN
MHARTVTTDARPEDLETGLTWLRDEAMPTVMAMPGCIGMSMAVDRPSGRCIGTTSWESEEAMRDSTEMIMPIRQRGTELLGAPPRIEEWEIALMHRNHRSGQGACVRSTWFEGAPDNVDQIVEVFKLSALPDIEQYDGFCSASLLIDQAAGRGLATIVYDSPEARARMTERSQAVRARTAAEMDAKVTDVRDFDLVMAHLHVPELA